MKYTNPRLKAEFENWPIGGNQKGGCVFEVEFIPKKGWRVIRTTQDRNGQWCKPKKHTFGDRTVIVDGTDGRTYILKHVAHYGMVMIIRSDFMSGGSAHHPDPEYDRLLAIINSAY